MDDNVIMARTGHKSQAGLDRYKRPGLTKNVARSRVALPFINKSFYKDGLYGRCNLKLELRFISSLVSACSINLMISTYSLHSEFVLFYDLEIPIQSKFF